MKVLAAIFLLILIVYNLIIASFRIYKVKPKLYIFIIGILFSLTFFYLWLNYAKDLQGFILGLLAICLFFTFTLGQGLREDGFLVFLGTTPILKLVAFDDIKRVDIYPNKKGGFNLDIKVYSSTFRQTYRDKDRRELINFVDNKLKSRINLI